MAGRPDPRPPRRKKDAKARRRASLLADECVVCERSDVRLNQHHILYGRDGRDDDERNFLSVCGSGTTGCHGRAHNGDHETLRKIGLAIATRPEKIAFVEERLGKTNGRDYLRRRYWLDTSVIPR
jgi:hypothetical protein